MLKTAAFLLTGGLIGPPVKNKITAPKSLVIRCVSCGKEESIPGYMRTEICGRCAGRKRK